MLAGRLEPFLDFRKLAMFKCTDRWNVARKPLGFLSRAAVRVNGALGQFRPIWQVLPAAPLSAFTQKQRTKDWDVRRVHAAPHPTDAVS